MPRIYKLPLFDYIHSINKLSQRRSKQNCEVTEETT